MATVYKAKCHVLNRYVAVKVLRDEFTTDEEFIKRFRIEAQSAASLTHPNIVSIYDVGNEGNLYYIVMELIKGKTLKEIITEERGPLPWKWSVNVAIQIASALEMAHKNNIIHRDIKPSNIFRGEDGVFKLGDFGSAVIAGQEIKEFDGTYNYIAPEIYNQEMPDYTSDIYSLGLVMYKLLNDNKLPFVDNITSEKKAVDQRLSGKALPKIKGVNPDVMKVLEKACAFKKMDRYQSATEFAAELKQAHFKIAGNVHKKKEESNFNKTISIQEMKKLETKEKHSFKQFFTDSNKEKVKKILGRFLGTLIIACIVLLFLTT